MRFLSAFLNFLITVALLAGCGMIYLLIGFIQPGPLKEAKSVIIPRGSSAVAIGKQLEAEGVIASRYIFRFKYFLQERPELKAGEYLFMPYISLSEVTYRLAKGDVVKRRITIPEGWTSAEVVRFLNKETTLNGAVATLPAEGSLLPETYQFTYGDERSGIVEHMQKMMRDTVDEAWAARDPDSPLQNPVQLVTLASMVEKETAQKSERARVAGVYINRLKKGMLLQSDPTVIYGMTLGLEPLGHALLVSELKKPSSFNTYIIAGLPPTPIANPGRAALMAAARPEKNNYLYFVADGNGGHRFAATDEEHAKNVALYRQAQKEGQQEEKKEEKPPQQPANQAPTATSAPSPDPAPAPPQ